MATDAWGIDDGWVDTQGRWQPASAGHHRGHPGRRWASPTGGRPVWVVRPGAAERLHGRCHLTLEDGTDLGRRRRACRPTSRSASTTWRPLDGGPVDDAPRRPRSLPPPRRPAGVGRRRPGPDRPGRRRSWGIGDLADVRALAAWLHDLGGGFLALSPLHAPTPVAPDRHQPLLPVQPPVAQPAARCASTRCPAGADPAVAALAARARALLADPLVDRDACWALQRAGPRAALGATSTTPAAHARRAGGPGRARRSRAGPGTARWPSSTGRSWRAWPAELRHPTAPAVARRRRPRWPTGSRSTPGSSSCVDEQLDAARAVGPRLVQDLAIGVDPGGADALAVAGPARATASASARRPTTSSPTGSAGGCRRGSRGRLRDRGLPPAGRPAPRALVAGGGLRIDHVMGLTPAVLGARGRIARPTAPTCASPGTELLELVALESARRARVVVGEDLGTVEPGFREELAAHGHPLDPARVVRARAARGVAAPGAGHGHHPRPPDAGRHAARASTGPAPMWRAPRGAWSDRSAGQPARRVAAGHPPPARRRAPPPWPPPPSRTCSASIERPNVPGTLDDERPNWSVALPVPLEDLRRDTDGRRILDALAAAPLDAVPPCPERDSNPHALSGSGV